MLGGDTLRVLIADDSDAIAERLIASLEDIDGLCIVGRASTVPDACQAVQTLRPDVIVLDLRMPGGSGLDVLEHMTRAGVMSTVIVFTNYTDRRYRTRCLERGARFFLDKSSEFERVRVVLKGLANQPPRDEENNDGHADGD